MIEEGSVSVLHMFYTERRARRCRDFLKQVGNPDLVDFVYYFHHED